MCGWLQELTHPHRQLLRTFTLTELVSPTASSAETKTFMRKVFVFSDLVLCARDVVGESAGGGGGGAGGSFMGIAVGDGKENFGVVGEREWKFEWGVPVGDLEVGGCGMFFFFFHSVCGVRLLTFEFIDRDFGIDLKWRCAGRSGEKRSVNFFNCYSNTRSYSYNA